MITLIVIEH